MRLHAAVFKPGVRLGFLGIDFATRRRNRMNAVVDAVADGRLHLRVLQSYGNCPKYIQARRCSPCRSMVACGCAPAIIMGLLAGCSCCACSLQYLVAACRTRCPSSHVPCPWP